MITKLFSQYVTQFAHIGISGLIYVFFYAIIHQDWKYRKEIAFMGTLLVGITKEYLDFIHLNEISGIDWVSNIIGLLIAVKLVKMIIRKK